MLQKAISTIALAIFILIDAHAFICTSTDAPTRREYVSRMPPDTPAQPKTEVRGTEQLPLFVNVTPNNEWAKVRVAGDEKESDETLSAIETAASVVSALLVASTLCWTLIRHHRDSKSKDSEHFMERAFDLAERAYHEMDESQCEFRQEVEGDKPLVRMAPKRDSALWMTVAEMLKEACLLRASVTESTHKRTYDAEIRYWRLKFSQMLRRGFPRLYYGDADVMTKYAFCIQERYLVPIYRFASVSMDIAKVQEVSFDYDELRSFVMGERPGLHAYIEYVRQA